MTIITDAVFEAGVLKPKTPLALVEGTEVRLTIRAIDGNAGQQSANDTHTPDGSDSAEPSLARRTYGLIGWTGDPEVVRRIALDPAFDLGEDLALDAAEGP
jgi:predicted DNA-binding antitoxin AbrB/MazE fold protein